MDGISSLRFAPLNPSTLPELNLQGLQGAKIPTQELQNLGSVGPAVDTFTKSNPVAGASFSDVLGNMVREVSAKQSAASSAVEGVMAGENVPLHQAMIAMEEASVSFQLMVEVRNKLLESYQELMRMQI